jgi:hypothetical protein
VNALADPGEHDLDSNEHRDRKRQQDTALAATKTNVSQDRYTDANALP